MNRLLLRVEDVFDVLERQRRFTGAEKVTYAKGWQRKAG